MLVSDGITRLMTSASSAGRMLLIVPIENSIGWWLKTRTECAGRLTFVRAAYVRWLISGPDHVEVAGLAVLAAAEAEQEEKHGGAHHLLLLRLASLKTIGRARSRKMAQASESGSKVSRVMTAFPPAIMRMSRTAP